MSSLDLDQRGKVNGLVLPFSLTITLLVVILIFGLWAFAGREDYRRNVDKKIAIAVKAAEQATSTKKDNEFLEKEKSPLKSYTGPEVYGKLTISYPKTWNALISDTGQSSNPVDGYFYPGVIPSNGGGNVLSSAAYALRIQVLSSSYDNAVKSYDGASASGKVKVTAYKPDKVDGTVGVRIDGQLSNGKTGSLVILPLRDKTIEVWTEANSYVGDFNASVLPSLTYEP